MTPGGATKQPYVSGAYADGTTLNLTSSVSGIVYASSDPSVVAIDTEELATPRAAGRATVSARLDAQVDTISIVVENPAQRLPPTSFAGQLQFVHCGFRLDRVSGPYLQDVTITNLSGNVLAGPLYLVLRGLPSTVALINKSGLTETIAPLASPFVSCRCRVRGSACRPEPA